MQVSSVDADNAGAERKLTEAGIAGFATTLNPIIFELIGLGTNHVQIK